MKVWLLELKLAGILKISFFSKNDKIVKEINNQIKENNNNKELLLYFQKRKTRVSPNNTIVKIPEQNITMLNEIKKLIVCYNFCVSSGVYKSQNKNKSIKNKKISDLYSKNLYNKLKNISYKIKIGEKHASKKH